MRRAITTAALATVLAGPATAEVTGVGPSGFATRHEALVAAPPAEVYAALTRFGGWWSSVHTYSQCAANLTLDPRPGGCLCERLPNGGGVQHMTVVYADPGKALRLRGGLGPLQAEGLAGALTWTLKPEGTGARLTQTYVVGGYAQAGVDKLAPVVDGVLGEQFARLKRYAEKGRP